MKIVDISSYKTNVLLNLLASLVSYRIPTSFSLVTQSMVKFDDLLYYIDFILS